MKHDAPRHSSIGLILMLLSGALVLDGRIHAQGEGEQPSPALPATLPGGVPVTMSGTLPSSKQDGTLVATFKNKFVFTTADGSASFRIGGRINNDWAWISADSDAESLFGKFEDGNEFRRARLYISGHVHRWLIFKTQYDFEDGESDFKDVYAGIKGLPWVGTFKAGQFKEPFSLEYLTSSNEITFMERSFADAFTPTRNTGFMLQDCICDERVTWAAGVFRDTDKFGDSKGDGEYNYTGRVTFLPIYEDKGEILIHTGVAASLRSPNDDTVTYVGRKEVNLAPVVGDTGAIANIDGVVLLGLELAAVWGPVSVQGEYKTSMVDGPGGNDPDFSGWNVMVSVFVTGEHRGYRTGTGVFANPKLHSNFDPEKGTWGALELAARYSNVDLTDGMVTGGDIDSITGGLNWYLNPNARLMFNVVCSDYSEGIDGSSEAFQMRIQFNF